MKCFTKKPNKTVLAASCMAAMLVLAGCSSDDDDIGTGGTDDGTVAVDTDGDSTADGDGAADGDTTADGDGAADADGTADGTATAEAAGAIFALTNRHDPAIQIGASDDAVSDPSQVNEVVAFSRSADGALEQIGVFPTGGLGENIRASGANPLASQDPLIVSKDNRFVFAVNAGSESISSFVINDDFSLSDGTLDISTTGSSGAQNPVSLTIFENTLYVVNTGVFPEVDGSPATAIPDVRNRVNSSIIGFTVNDDGTLTELANSELPGVGANAGSIEFSSNGQFLYVTERRTNDILTIPLDGNRLPIPNDAGSFDFLALTSQTEQPFGTDLYPTDNGDILLVSEGNNGATGLSALSTYLIEDNGTLTGISLSSGVEGDPLVTGFTFGCWVEFVETPTGDFAYVSNTPDGVITSYAVGDEGGLSVLESSAGVTGIEGDDTQNGAGVLDVEIVFPFLYQVVNNDGRIAQFVINDDGSLDRQLDAEVVDTDLFRGGMFVGVAGF